jgi:hypothetical protein
MSNIIQGGIYGDEKHIKFSKPIVMQKLSKINNLLNSICAIKLGIKSPHEVLYNFSTLIISKNKNYDS